MIRLSSLFSRGFLCVLIFAAAIAQAQPTPAQTTSKSTPNPRLGMNVGAVQDWSSQIAFVDMFRAARMWVSQKEGAAWAKGPPLKYDAHGYVTQLDPGCYIETLIFTSISPHYPSGQYTLLYEGQADITFSDSATITQKSPGKILVQVDASKGGVKMQVKNIDPKNYLRNIRFILPGFEATYEKEPFYPSFLKRCQGMACLRFMDWMSTNGSKTVSWNERPTLDDVTWSVRGVPVERMVELCNLLRCDGWFCMPAHANDEYVRNFAAYVKDHMNPSLKVYIEYSNEVWNGGFEQNGYAAKKWNELHSDDQKKPWEGACLYYGQRSMEVFKIWEEVFGGVNRLQRTIAWQAVADPGFWLDGMLLKRIDATKVDALAIAPYLAFMPRPASANSKDTPSAEVIATWTVDQVLDAVEQKILPQTISVIQRDAAVAKKYNLKLVSYEAGQHFLGLGEAMNNEKLTKLLIEANYSQRMGKIYDAYYKAWEASGGDLLNHFLDIGRWTKYGSWGLIEYYDQGPSDSPKLRATLDWAKSRGQNVFMQATMTK